MAKAATLVIERGSLFTTEVPHRVPFSNSVFHTYVGLGFSQGMVEKGLIIS